MNKKLSLLTTIILISILTLLTASFSGKIYSNELHTDNINNIVYVESGNANDLENKVENCNDCTVIIPCGTYNVDTNSINIMIPSNSNIIGMGTCTVINRSGGTNRVFYLDDDTTDVRISNFKMTMNNLGSALDLTSNGNNKRIEIDHLHIYDMGSPFCIKVNASSSKITNNYCYNVKNGIGLNDNSGGSEYSIIANNYINTSKWNNGVSEYGEGIEINTHTGTGNVIVRDNFISGFSEQGIDFNAQRGIIENNIIYMVDNETRGSNGIVVAHSYNYNTTVLVKGNNVFDITDGNNGLYLKNDALGQFSNTIIGNNFVGVTGQTTAKGVLYAGLQTSITLIGNSFENLNRGIYDQALIGSSIYNFGNSFLDVTTDYATSITNINDKQVINFNQGSRWTFYLNDTNNTGVRVQNGYFDVYSPTTEQDAGFRIIPYNNEIYLTAYDGGGFSNKKDININADGGNVSIGSISGDGNGKVVCINSDGDLGTCTDTVGAGGTCTCV